MKSEKTISNMLALLESEEEPTKAQLQEINELNKQLREKYIHVLGNSNIRVKLWDQIYGRPIQSNYKLDIDQWIAPNPQVIQQYPELKTMSDNKKMVQTSRHLIGGKAMLVFFNGRIMIEKVGVFPKEAFCVVLNPNNEELPDEHSGV